MAQLTREQIEGVFEVWNQTVFRPGTPDPLNYQQLRERLNLPKKPEKPTAESLLIMATAVLSLPTDAEDKSLIEASYVWLVKQVAPWASKSKKIR